jgi:hypothetical protein
MYYERVFNLKVAGYSKEIRQQELTRIYMERAEKWVASDGSEMVRGSRLHLVADRAEGNPLTESV